MMISRRLLRIKILQILYSHFNGDNSDNNKPEKELIFSVQKAYDLYFYLLLLVTNLKRYAESRIELARNKRLPTYEDLHPNTRFVDNEAILSITENQSFKQYLKEHKLSWVSHPELIKNLYNRLIDSSYYKEYMDNPACDFKDDKQLLVDFYSNELEDNQMFYEILEEHSIFWNDDIEFILLMVIKTIMEMGPKKTTIFPLYKSDDDRVFAFQLLQTTIVHYDEYRKLIEQYIDNWDIDRVAHIDILILQMAINELIEFPSIPVNVTFDEYLELAKYYSTPKSFLFINGLLDNMTTAMIQEGRIAKTGRGLVSE